MATLLITPLNERCFKVVLIKLRATYVLYSSQMDLITRAINGERQATRELERLTRTIGSRTRTKKIF